MKKHKHRRVRVEWVDSISTHGWHYLDDLPSCKPEQVTSIGYVLRESRHALMLAHSLGTDPPQALGIVLIPKHCIRRIRKL